MCIRIIVPGSTSIKSIANTYYASKISLNIVSDFFLRTRYDVIVYVILLQETCQSILFFQVHHLNSNCRKNVAYSGHSLKSMANCVKSRFSLNLQLFSVVLKSVHVKYIASYCPWDLHQIHSSCTSMSFWWKNNPSLWLSWTVSIPKWVSILWHAACAPSDAKLFAGGVHGTYDLDG